MRNNQAATDDSGRPVHVMGTGRKQEMRSQSEVLERLWENDQIDRPMWMGCLAAAAQRADTPEDAGELADALYFEFFRRANGM